MPYRPMDDETRTIVVNVGNKIMGCTVDRVTRVLRVEKDAIARAPETIVADGRTYIRGFATVNDRLVIVLDVAELLSPERTRNISTTNEPTASLSDPWPKLHPVPKLLRLVVSPLRLQFNQWILSSPTYGHWSMRSIARKPHDRV